MNVLLALKAYERGKPANSSKSQWKVNADIAAALDCAFYKSFKVIEMLRNFHRYYAMFRKNNRMRSGESLTLLESGRTSSHMKFCTTGLQDQSSRME